MLPALVFVVAAFATVFCAAINCYTYRIAYPLWRCAGRAEFPSLHAQYLKLLTPVITAPHVVMFFASGGLMRWRPAWIDAREAIGLFALDAAVVAISAFLAGPIHDRFTRDREIDDAAFRRLMRISAVRVVLMVAACALAGRMTLVGLR